MPQQSRHRAAKVYRFRANPKGIVRFSWACWRAMSRPQKLDDATFRKERDAIERAFRPRSSPDDGSQMNGLIKSIPSIIFGAPMSSVYSRDTLAA